MTTQEWHGVWGRARGLWGRARGKEGGGARGRVGVATLICWVKNL